jgi:hypothetical protein
MNKKLQALRKTASFRAPERRKKDGRGEKSAGPERTERSKKVEKPAEPEHRSNDEGFTKISHEERTNPEFVQKSLIGYEPVALRDIGTVKPEDQIRYINDSGEFRFGGTMMSLGEKEGKPYWVVKVPSGTGTYVLYLSKIKKLWKRAGVNMVDLGEAINREHDFIVDIANFLVMKYGHEFHQYLMVRQEERKRMA